MIDGNYIFHVIEDDVCWNYRPVGGLEHEFYCSIQLGMSSSQLTFIFFRGVETTSQTMVYLMCFSIRILGGAVEIMNVLFF